MVDGVHSLVCLVLGLGGFVQLHLMASVSHLQCLVAPSASPTVEKLPEMIPRAVQVSRLRNSLFESLVM